MMRTKVVIALLALALPGTALAQSPTPIRCWDGNAFNCSDEANSALRVVLVGTLGSTTVTANQGTAGSHAQRWMVGLSDGSGFISPALDRATAGAPSSCRLSDGSAFLSPVDVDLDSGGGTVLRLSLGLLGAASGGPVAIQGASTTPDITATGVVTRPIPQNRTISGSLNALNATVAIDADGASTILGAIASSFDGSAVVEGTADGTIWYELQSMRLDFQAGDALLTGFGGGDVGFITPTGWRQVRFRAEVFSGTAGVATLVASSGGPEVQKVIATVGGTITANAGTNLNTSALALEAGGNLAASAISLAVLDDWDETDRAKVNSIVGQAGVQGGAGPTTATTQRVALATDANGVKLTDGTDTADIFDLTNSNPLACAVVDASGDQISSFGGGTQYTEGDIDASITGTALLWEDGSDTLRAVSAAKPLPVEIIAGGGSGTSSSFGSALPASGTAAGFSDGTNMQGARVFDTDSGGGTQYVAGVNLRKAASGGSVEAGTSADPFRVDPIGTTAQPVTDNGGSLTVDGTVTANQGGTWNINNVSGTVSLPTGASSLAEQQTQTTSLQKIDNIAHSGSDVALVEHVPISGQLDDASTTTVTENQVAPLRITTGRALHVAQQGTVTVTGTVTANAGSGTMTVDSELPAAAALVDNTANPTVPAVGTFLHAWDGSNWDRVQTGAATGGALKVDGSAVTQPVSGTVTANAGSGTFTISGTVTANAGTNLNTSALALESGGNLATVAGAVHAEDEASADTHKGIPAMAVRKATPANTSGSDGDYENLQVSAGRLWTSATIDAALPTGSNVIGALSANQSANVAQINGVAPSMGNGVSGTGVQRVTIASDSTGQVALAAGSATIGALTADQTVNLNKLAGNAISSGNGTSGTGTVRVSVASDSTGQVKSLGQNSTAPIYCQSVANLDMTTATTTELVAISGSTVIYICSYALEANGTTAAKLVRGTGTNCATGQAAITPNFDWTAQTGIDRNGGGGNVVAKGNAGDAVCATSGSAVNLHVTISYAQF